MPVSNMVYSLEFSNQNILHALLFVLEKLSLWQCMNLLHYRTKRFISEVTRELLCSPSCATRNRPVKHTDHKIPLNIISCSTITNLNQSVSLRLVLQFSLCSFISHLLNLVKVNISSEICIVSDKPGLLGSDAVSVDGWYRRVGNNVTFVRYSTTTTDSNPYILWNFQYASKVQNLNYKLSRKVQYLQKFKHDFW